MMKARRKASPATIARLRAMRQKYGLGEFAKGDPFKGKRRLSGKRRKVVRRAKNFVRATFHRMGLGMGLGA